MPDEPEVHGLLAMMLLHDARRETRYTSTPARDVVLLADQDHSLRDTAQAYVLQAAIASLHADESRDWPRGRAGVG